MAGKKKKKKEKKPKANLSQGNGTSLPVDDSEPTAQSESSAELEPKTETKQPASFEIADDLKQVADAQKQAAAQEAPPHVIKNDYYLKPMVMARILAEATALLLMFLAPFLLMALGKFWGFSPVLQLLFGGVALVAACILPVYGFIPYRVSIRADRITSHSVLSSPSASLAEITAVNRRSTLNWVRYVAIYDGGEINIPVWLQNVDQLIALIKSRFPQYLRLVAAPRGRTFKCDPLAIVVQFAQVLLSLIFIAVCWSFTSAVHRKEDLLLVYGFAAIVSIVLLYRAYIVLMMPKAIKVEAQTIEVHTVFFKKVIDCSKVKSVKPSTPFLPEGQMLETQSGSFLIGNSMDEADDLVTALREMALAFKK